MLSIQDFNSHARVGRDADRAGTSTQHVISTHTPAWGVTQIIDSLIDYLLISTHTPAWGVT